MKRVCNFCHKEKNIFIPVIVAKDKDHEVDWKTTFFAQKLDKEDEVYVMKLCCRQCFKKDKFEE